MFKIKDYDEYISKTVRFPRELSEILAQLAFDNDISLSMLVVQCIQYAIDNLKDPSKDN